MGGANTTEILTLVARTAILWMVALVILRFIGKRTLGKMGPFDYAVTIMIGEPIITLNGMDNRSDRIPLRGG